MNNVSLNIYHMLFFFYTDPPPPSLYTWEEKVHKNICFHNSLVINIVMYSICNILVLIFLIFSFIFKQNTYFKSRTFFRKIIKWHYLHYFIIIVLVRFLFSLPKNIELEKQTFPKTHTPYGVLMLLMRHENHILIFWSHAVWCLHTHKQFCSLL